MKWKIGAGLLIWISCLAAASAQHAGDAKHDDSDDRLPVMLMPAEKAYVFEQMRLFVAGIQSIATGLADGNRALASEAASARGFKRNANDPAFPPTLNAKLPADWKQLGGTMRKGFDALAEGITKGDTPQQSLTVLGELMKNCVSCHATFRVVAVQEK